MIRVHVNGIGLHTTLGRGLPDNLAALKRPPVAPREHAVEFAGESRLVPCYLLADLPLTQIEQRFDAAIHGVVDEALSEAKLSASERRNIALFLGSSCGDMPILEAEYRRDLQKSIHALPLATTSSLGNLATRIREHFGFRGPDYSFYTACTASANALWYAANMIRSGSIEHAVVVGVEIFNAVTALGFSGLQLLTHDVMRPFDRRRSGLVPGEACVAIVLSARRSKSHAWRISGGANLCDTHSISATNPDGSAVVSVIRRALRESALNEADIAAVKLHGTASLLNDEAESAGVRQSFGSAMTYCALKPYLGHTYGACGGTEMALFCGSVGNGYLPGTPGICAGDSDLQIALNQSPRPQSPGHFMLNYFGFGGSNTCLVVSNHE